MTPSQLHAWRKGHGLSQTEMAKMLEVSIFTVQRWEKGSVKIPSYLGKALYGIDMKQALGALKAVDRMWEEEN